MRLALQNLLLCLLLANVCRGQDSVPIVPRNEFFLKINPLAVFEADGGIGFSAEYLLAKSRIGLQLEVQPIFFTVARNGYKIDQPKDVIDPGSPSGVKLRPEVRFYLKGLRSEPYFEKRILGFSGKQLQPAQPIRTYVAVDFLYKFSRYDRIDDLRNWIGGIQYINPLRTTYTEIKRVYGFDLKIGSVSQSFPNKHFWVEAFAGIGARLKIYSYRNIPASGMPPDRYFQFYTYRTTYSYSHTKLFRPSLPAGVKLVYRF